MLSIRSQMVLSTHGVQDVGLPPASPSDDESLPVVSIIIMLNLAIIMLNSAIIMNN